MALNQEAIDAIKTILGQQTSELKKEFNEQVKNINKNNAENAEQIKESIAGLSQKIAQNTESITNISNRVDNIENDFKDMHNRMIQLEQGPSTAQEHRVNITKTNAISQEIQEKLDNTKADITKAAHEIVGITPITEEDLERNSNSMITQNDTLLFAAFEFLHKELGYTQEDCKQLDIIRVTRRRTPNTDRLYIHFATEKSAEYLQRMVRVINSKIKETNGRRPNSKMFIPPQLHNRFADLSKLCYDKRQEDK